MPDEVALLDFAGVASDQTAISTDSETSFDLDSISEGTGTTETTGTTEGGKEGTTEDKGAATTTETTETPGKTAEGTEKTTPTEATPDSVRKTLKGWRDADQKNSTIVKELHNAYERWNAANKIFPSVTEMRAAKEFIDLVGGQEGYEKLDSMVKSVEESDQKLYSGDPSLWDDVISDLKSEGKLDALGKLAPAFFENLKKYDKDGYYDAFAPHFLSGIDEVNIPGAIGAIVEALKVPENATPEQLNAAMSKIRTVADGMDKWYKGLKKTSDEAKSKQADPERVKLDEERKKFQQEQETFKTNQTKEFQRNVASESAQHDNEALGGHLKAFLKMPFFKGFPRETLVDLAQGIKSRLYSSLESDGIYQKQMKALWGAKSPDRGKIIEYHNNKVNSIASEIVRQTVQSRYPSYAKGGSAAGRVAAKQEKQAAQTKVEQKAAAEGRPVFVNIKPSWDEIDHTRDPKDLLFIAGKAFLKNGKFITWRK